jgi:predicted nucleic acid-binding protein
MNKLLLDTNAYVAFKQGRPEAIEILRLAAGIGICSIVMGELLAGFVSGTKEAENRVELARFCASPRVTLLPADHETAEFYARIFKQLKALGQPIPTNDLWIAAIAMQHGCAVFTYDKHFAAVANLAVCHRVADLLP